MHCRRRDLYFKQCMIVMKNSYVSYEKLIMWVMKNSCELWKTHMWVMNNSYMNNSYELWITHVSYEDLCELYEEVTVFTNMKLAKLIKSNRLKPVDTFGKQYCPRPTLRVSQLIYKITNLWKFRLNRSSESGENNGKTHSCFRTFRRVMTCV